MNTFSVPNTKEATTVEKKSFKKYYLEMVFKFASAKSIAMDVHAAREKLMDYLEENPTVAAAIFEKSQAQRVALADHLPTPHHALPASMMESSVETEAKRLV